MIKSLTAAWLVLFFLFTERTILAQQERKNNKAGFLLKEEKARLQNIEQLTFSGENAEAYFSADGQSLVFQSHKGDSLCDQIYIMDIKTRKTTLVSTGKGVTTCAYFEYPECKNIIYSSTHQVSEKCPPRADYSRGYVWKLYTDYDIFHSSTKGTGLKQLTKSNGYDAEATVATDGSKIIYTSIASGDLELWTMNIDGTNKRMLTNRLGYDGGAFFNTKGNKIVWRAYYPETPQDVSEYKNLLRENSIRPMKLQIWTMNSDGSNKTQITDNNGANFGPYFFPDGKRIIFSSNLHNPDGRNFDLYSINIDGSGLEQVTFYDGFDGFPMFSPDGKFLVFSSNRNQVKRGDTNLFLAEWKY